jgi:hypothetical protein
MGKLNFFMLLGGPQNTIKSHLVFTALFCFAPFSVFSSRICAPHSEDIRFRFKATLRCLEAAVFLLMGVLKSHSQRSAEKYTNMYVVSSYHSTITQARDTNYFKQSRLYRDLMKTQKNKTNKLKVCIEKGDLENQEYRELGLKGIELHRYMQDRRQLYHDTALAKAHGPFPVRPGGTARFEKEIRYNVSTASVEPMQPIELYQAYVDKDQ